MWTVEAFVGTLAWIASFPALFHSFRDRLTFDPTEVRREKAWDILENFGT